jgi:GrpB-like predicted nucleotidyltransferase (UPF0157 family)
MMHEDRVRLMYYDPRWRQEFEQTRSSILHSCVGWVTAVEHIGSTSIPGLVARPTIDVVAAAEDDEGLERAATLIEGLNYRRQPSPAWAVESTVLVKPRHPLPDQPDPTHLVLLVLRGSSLWTRVIRMRDYLQTNPETAIRFEEAKVAQWRSGEGALANYQARKGVFFSHLEDQIEAAGRGE